MYHVAYVRSGNEVKETQYSEYRTQETGGRIMAKAKAHDGDGFFVLPITHHPLLITVFKVAGAPQCGVNCRRS
jgi:hypothetical protein